MKASRTFSVPAALKGETESRKNPLGVEGYFITDIV